MKFYLLPDGTVSTKMVDGATEISKDQFLALGGTVPTADTTEEDDESDSPVYDLTEDSEMRTRHAELAARLEEIGAPTSIVALDERNAIRAEMNHYAAAVNRLAAGDTEETIELVEPGEAPATPEGAENTTETPEGGAPAPEGGEPAPSSAPTADAEPTAPVSADDVSNTDPSTNGNGNVAPEAPVEMATITAGASSSAGPGNAMSFSDLGRGIADALSNGGNGISIVASVNAYGHVADNENALGDNARRNHEILFGGRQDLTVTAAVCGPPEPIRRLPDCFQMGMPFSQVLTTQQVRYGSIQVYAPLSLPDNIDAVMIPGPECVNCAPNMDQECLCAACVEPLDAVDAIPLSSCLQVPEQLMFADDFVLEQYVKQLTTGFERSVERWRMGVVRENSYVRQFTSPYGHSLGVRQAAMQVMAQLSYKTRSNGGIVDLSNYFMVIPPGDKFVAATDEMNRVVRSQNGMDDYIAWFESKGATVIEAMDFDLAGSIDPAPPTGFTGALGNAAAAPLEGFHQTPSIYFVPRGKFLHGSPFDIEVGVDNRDKSEVESGCTRMIRREWWTPPVPFGCASSVVVDFTEACAPGTYPGAVGPVCNGALAGQAADDSLGIDGDELGDGPIGE